MITAYNETTSEITLTLNSTELVDLSTGFLHGLTQDRSTTLILLVALVGKETNMVESLATRLKGKVPDSALVVLLTLAQQLHDLPTSEFKKMMAEDAE